jgi:hypothetical protein
LCNQISLLNQRLSEVHKRYNVAQRENQGAFRYNYRIRLGVVEGLRNTYYEYAQLKEDEIADLRRDLFGETVFDSDSDSDSDSDFDSDFDSGIDPGSGSDY